MNEKIDICKVIGSEEIIEHEDDYYGYYGLYVCKKLLIEKELSRDEILKTVFDSSEEQLIRLIIGYKLSPNEYNAILNLYNSNARICDAINYYQLGKTDTYEKRYKSSYKR